MHDCKIVGFANGGEARHPEIDATGELYALYVLASHQNQGIGKQLFDAVRGNLKSRGLEPFITWVLADNPARGFYKKAEGAVKMRKSTDFCGTPLTEVAFIWKN